MISIILPYYNGSAFVKDTIKSIVSQSYRDFEVLIVDDGSPLEKESEYIKSCIQELNDPRFKYIRKENGGLSDARNFGISNSSGEYIAFIDQDDYWRENKLEIQMEIFSRRRDIDFVFTKMDILNGNEIKASAMPSWFKLKEDGEVIDPYLLMLRNNYIPCSSVVFRRGVAQKAGGSNKSFTVCPDYELFIRMSKVARFYYIHDPLLVYRVHDNNTVKQSIRIFCEVLLILFNSKATRNKEKINATLNYLNIIYRLLIFWAVKTIKSR